MPISEAVATLMQDADLRAEIEALRISALRRRMLDDQGELNTFNSARLQRNLVSIGRAVRRAAMEGGEPDPGVRQAALFVARSYEQLAEVRVVNRPSMLMLAALNYELAGYQANAATLARLASDISRLPVSSTPDLEQLASLFLQRRFLRLSLAGSSGSGRQRQMVLNAENLLAAARDLTETGLAKASRYFLNGNADALSEAAEDLEAVREAMIDIGAAPQALLVNGLRSVLPRLKNTSIWTNLLPHLPDNRLWTRYLMTLGRGMGSGGALEARSISELWPSQLGALDDDILAPGSRVVRMPTSAGKTRVAEMSIVHALAMRPGARALYVGPFNALTNEVTASLNDLFVDLGLSVSSLPGNYEISTVDEDALNDDLLVLTPEKLDQLLRSNSEFIDEIDVVILDEGHVVGEDTRGPKYELVISRLRQRRPDTKFVALSAVVPNETLREFSEWLGSTDDPVSSMWRPTVQRLAKLRWQGSRGDLVYTGLDHDDLVVPGVINTEVFEHRNPRTNHVRRPRFPEGNHRAQVAAAFAWQVVEHGGVLIYCATPNYASSVASAIAQRVEYADLTEEAVPAPLRPRFVPRSAVVAEEWLGPDHTITRHLRQGIGVHYAAIPGPVKAAIEDDFRNRRLAVLAATPTLAQGVNLPVRTLIVHTTRRYDDDLSRQVQLSARDFWNIAGRVGRAGAETEGTVVFLSFTPADEEDYLYFERSRDKVERVTSALHRMLQDLVARRISGPEAARKLDPEMLAILVEEGDGALTSDGLKAALGQTLFAIQGRTDHVSSEPLWSLMAATSSVIAKVVTDSELRAVYAGTGLSAISCTEISQHVESNRDLLVAAFAEVTDWQAVRQLLLEGLVRCREMNPRTTLEIGHEQLMEQWLTGRSVSDLAEEFEVDPIRLTSFIEDFFGYRLPWGLSAYLRICAHALGVDVVPVHLEQLPLQIRYGVPSLSASWVMALGVDSRVLAVMLADSFERTNLTQSPGGLRRWLSSLDVEDLADELGIPVSALPTVRQVALKANGNELLRAYYDGEAGLFPLSVEAFARPGADNRKTLTSLVSGSVLEVRRDYDGAHRNSVILLANGFALARLPRMASDAIAIEMDAGREVQAFLDDVSVTGMDTYRLAVTLN